MRVRLLGPLELDGSTGPLPLARAKERALVTILALHAGTVVSEDRLVGALWGDDPPRTAIKTLQSYVSRVRAMFASTSSDIAIETGAGGYALRLAANALDVHRVELLLAQARAAMDRDEAPEASVALAEALHAFRGEPLGEFADQSWATAEAARLTELQLIVIEEHVEARLACGEHSALVAELDSLCAAHPLRERLWAQRMLALYRSGRQADALRVYQELRRLLADELGIDPNPELKALEGAILSQDPNLIWDRSTRSGAGVQPYADTRSVEITLPSRLETRPWGAFVGRGDHLTAIARAVDDHTEGGHRLLLVPGPPGIGKTTLVLQAARHAHDTGAVVLYGRCDEDLGVPYQPFAEALTQLVGRASDALVDEHVTAYGPVLARLVPSLAERVADLPRAVTADPDAERYLLYGAVEHLLHAAGRDAPVLLIIDDLHWIDRPSLHVLHHLVSAPAPLNLVIVATYRELEVTPDSPLNHFLVGSRRDAVADRLPLDGLEPHDIVELIGAATGRHASSSAVEFANALHLDTAGNPFFVAEVLRHLAETGRLLQDDVVSKGALHLGDATVPDNVREVIRARVSRLGSAAEQVLTAAAVVGVEFDADLVGSVSGLDDTDLLDVLDAALAASLVRETGESPGHYGFSHALIQQTLYQQLSATRRARTHREIAVALENARWGRREPPVVELARHWMAAADPESHDKALHYGLAAGEAALASLAPDEAMRQFLHALDLYDASNLDDPLLRVDLLIGLGTAQQQVGVSAYRATLLEAARAAQDLNDVDRLVRAALANTRGQHSASGTVDRERVEILEAGLEVLRAPDSPERALLLATLCTEVTYGAPFARRRALADEARAIARRVGDASLRVTVDNLIGYSMMVPSTLEERLTETAEILQLADQLGDPALQFWANFNRSQSAHEAGLAHADEYDDRLVELNLRLRQPTLAWFAAFRQAAKTLYHGDPIAGEQLAVEALELGNNSGQPDAMIAFGSALIVARLVTGQLGELIPLISQFIADTPELPAYRAVLALAFIEAGEDQQAAAELDEAFQSDFELLPFDYVWLTAMSCYAMVAAHLRAVPAGERLLQRLGPWHWQVCDVGGAIVHPVSLCLGELAGALGRYDEAERWLYEADEIAERTNAPFAIARSHLAKARVLVARGDVNDRERARELAGLSMEIGAGGGYANVVKRAEELLRGIS